MAEKRIPKQAFHYIPREEEILIVQERDEKLRPRSLLWPEVKMDASYVSRRYNVSPF
jgi:hypothetical protein